MPKWRNAVIAMLLLSSFCSLCGQNLPAPTFDPPPGSIKCPTSIEIDENVPNAQIVRTTDGSPPKPDSITDAYLGIETVRNWEYIPIHETTTFRAIAVSRADSDSGKPYWISTESDATYTCINASDSSPKFPKGIPDDPSTAKGIGAVITSTRSKNGSPASKDNSATRRASNSETVSIDKDRKLEQPEKLHRQPEPLAPATPWWFWLWRFRLKVVVSLLGLLVLWLSLIATTHLLYSQRTGGPGFSFLRERIIPAPSFEISRLAADDRRRRLQAFLNEFREGIDGVPIEFIDVPRELKVESRRFGQDDSSRFWHASRLFLQLQSDHYLLLERVTDSLVCLQRDGRLKSDDFPISVRLEKKLNWRSQKLLPWRVVIVTTKPRALKELILALDIGNWLGIEIAFLRPARRLFRRYGRNSQGDPPGAVIQPQGRCMLGSDGLEGTVGGVVHDVHNQVYGVTCRHVLSSDCGSLYWPDRPVRPPTHEFTLEVPDVALIGMGSSCFARNNGSRVPATPATQTDIDLAADHESRIHKSPGSDGVRGIVLFSNVSGFKLGNHFYRGPHFQITPAFYRKWGIVWPRSGRFSAKGDSGAWVVNSETRQWLGMIVGGFASPNRLSVALSASHICDAFARSQGAARTPIAPEVFQ